MSSRQMHRKRNNRFVRNDIKENDRNMSLEIDKNVFMRYYLNGLQLKGGEQ